MSLVPATDTESAWVLSLLQASDSLYPTGSYAHSFGLEGLVQEGVVRDRATLRAFVHDSALPALGRVDLPLTAHAWVALGVPDWARVGEVCILSAALKTAREARVASESIGRQRAELTANLQRSDLATQYLEQLATNAWPHAAAVSAALEGRVAGAPLPAVLAGFAYGNLAGLLAAAMKLLRLGQNGAQSLLTESLATVPALIAEAQILPLDQIGWFNPWLDIAAARHEVADSRMFIS